jgi:hypothetical protein
MSSNVPEVCCIQNIVCLYIQGKIRTYRCERNGMYKGDNIEVTVINEIYGVCQYLFCT